MTKTMLTVIAAFAGAATASPFYDANVTPNAIFGSGNANGGFTVVQESGIELGLRAKTRFNASNQPENTFNSNGDGSYTFNAGLPPVGFGFAPGSTSTALWNFEWSVNSSFDGTGTNLDGYTYELSIDFDPAEGVEDFYTFDPINQPWADNSIGTNATAAGQGTEAAFGDAAAYASLISSNNLAQNSWNMEFFDGAGVSGKSFDGRATGEYIIMLEAFDNEGTSIGMTSIRVVVVPMPAAGAMAGVGLIALGARRRR